MIHFTGKTKDMASMTKEEKKRWLREVDLTKQEFLVKITNFGLSRKVAEKEEEII